MYIFGNPFILVEHGFTKNTRNTEQKKPVNDLVIKDSSYDNSKPLIAGLYTIEDDNVIANPNHNVNEISKILNNYTQKRLDIYK